MTWLMFRFQARWGQNEALAVLAKVTAFPLQISGKEKAARIVRVAPLPEPPAGAAAVINARRRRKGAQAPGCLRSSGIGTNDDASRIESQ
jgi:hypothetical protein